MLHVLSRVNCHSLAVSVPLGMYQALIVWDLCEFVPDAPGPVRSHTVPFLGAPAVWLCSQVGTGQPAASTLSWGSHSFLFYIYMVHLHGPSNELPLNQWGALVLPMS